MRWQLMGGLAGLLICISATGYADNLLGVVCESPPPMHCQNGDCAQKVATPGTAVEPKSGRQFYLDYPCDLKPDETVTFILNIHGAGSIANWQRHYFPVMDYKEKYRLVIATPTAAGSRSMGGGPPIRVWSADTDDEYLQNIVDLVTESLGSERVGSFWLAGHSQGGSTSHRLVCTDYFSDKVDGLLSLSGGRIGTAKIVAAFGPPGPDGKPPPPRERRFPERPLPACDFSHIYATGEHEIEALPEDSPWAEKYQCGSRAREQIIDTEPGWVTDSNRQGYPVWGMAARPGTSEVFVYPGCKEDRVVADVVRIDKGHTEGLEPKVTERIVQLMVAAGSR